MKKTDLHTKVESWLERAGYALEMRVAREFRRKGFTAIQADYYRDPQSEELREIDVIAHRDPRISAERLTVAVVVECKQSEKPWVLLARRHGFEPETSVRQRPGTNRCRRVLEELADNPEVQKLSLFHLVDPLGYSLVTALGAENKASTEPTYKALQSVTSACAGYLEGPAGSSKMFATMAWPLIVLKGRLFRASLTSRSGVSVREIQKGMLAWRNPRLAGHSYVTVVTEQHLPKVAAQLARDIDSFVHLASYELLHHQP